MTVSTRPCLRAVEPVALTEQAQLSAKKNDLPSRDMQTPFGNMSLWMIGARRVRAPGS